MGSVNEKANKLHTKEKSLPWSYQYESRNEVCLVRCMYTMAFQQSKLQRYCLLVTHGQLFRKIVMCQVKIILVTTRGSPAQGWVKLVTRWTRSLLQGVTHLPNREQQEFKREVTSSKWKGHWTVVSQALANPLEGTGVWKVKKPQKDRENMAG